MMKFKEYVQWAKYGAIILYSDLTGKSIVNLFGATYCVFGNNVKRIGNMK